MAGSILDLVGGALTGRVPVQAITIALRGMAVQSDAQAGPNLTVGQLVAAVPLPILAGLPELPLPATPIEYALRLDGPVGAPTGFTLDLLIGANSLEVPALGAKVSGEIAVRIEAEPGQDPVTIRPFAAPTGGSLVPLPVNLPALDLAVVPVDVSLGATPFKLHVESVRIEPVIGPGTIKSVRTVIPQADLHLPWVPAFGALTVHIEDLAIDPIMGMSGTSSVDVPHSSLEGLTIDVDWDQPSARSLDDLMPSGVRITADVPANLSKPLPATIGSPGPVKAHAANGGAIRLVASLGPDSTGQTRAAIQIDAAGSQDGLLVIDEDPAKTILAIALMLASGVLGPLPEVGDGAAGLAAVVGAAVPLEGASIGGVKVFHDGEVVVQSVRIDAPLGDAGQPPWASIDVSAALAVDVDLGLVRILTRSDGPLRVRYRDIRATVGDGSPGSGDITSATVDFRSAQPILESPGSWEVLGLGDLLRVSGVRSGAGSSWFEIDLELGIDLGLVKVDTATVRVKLDGGAAVEMRGLGVTISVPGVLEGSGQGRIAAGRIEAQAAAKLPALGLAAAASFEYAEPTPAAGRPMLKIDIDVAFPGPLPLGSTGLGLFGIGGVFGMNAKRKLDNPSPDPVVREFDYFNQGSFPALQPGDGVAFGARAVIGTIPDLGFAFNAVGSLVVLSPEVTVIVGLKIGLLKGKPSLNDSLGTVGVGITGLLVVDGNGVVIGARGDLDFRPLVHGTLPVGAYFPFNGDPNWFIRIGADDHGGRLGGPIAIAVLPDLIDLSAWAYLMFEGDGLMDMGGKLDVANNGFAIGFGVGWEIEWFAFPLHLSAFGEVLVGLATSPWAFVGHARIGGSLDLGPVSLSLTASLDVEVGEGRPLHAHGEFCGYVDLFFCEVGGCIGIDIGPDPVFPIPTPPSPLIEVNLVDRTGKVIGRVPGGVGGPGPKVWPDAVPVLTFNTWVETALLFGPFREHLVGQPPPPINGWTGSQDLGYRFKLIRLEMTATKDGQTTDVTDDLFAAWSLPKHGLPFGSPGVPPVTGARELNLLTWENALWARSLIDGGASAPGDPVKSVGAPCLDPPGVDCTLLVGVDAHHAPGGFGWGNEFDVWRVKGNEFTASGKWSVDGLGVLDGQTAPAHAAEMHGTFEPGGVRALPGTLATSLGDFDGVWALPALRGNVEFGDEKHFVELTLSEPIRDVVLEIAIDPLGRERDFGDDWQPVSVSGLDPDDGSIVPFDIHIESGQGIVGRVDTFTPPENRRWWILIIEFEPVARPGIIALRGCASDSVSDAVWIGQSREKLKEFNTELVTSAYPKGRSLLDEGTTYTLTVGMTWQGRGGSPHQELSPEALPDQTFSFTTASAGAYGDSAAQGYLQQLHKRHNSFDARGLTRYVRGFHPTGSGAFHFTKDPISVDMSIDYMEQLVNIYGGTLRLRARRVDPPPGTPPPPLEPAVDDGLISLYAPFSPWLIDVADANLIAAAALAACPTPTGGGVTAATFSDLDRRAQYEVALVAMPNPGGALGKAEVASALFSTSAFETPDEMLNALSGSTARMGDVQLDLAVAGALATLSGSGDEAFENALYRLGMDPWPLAIGPRFSRLWVPDAEHKWLCAGFLLELDEPIVRPNRLDQFSLSAPGVILNGPIVDSLGTRIAFLAGAPFLPSAGDLILTARCVEPWTPAGSRSISRSLPTALEPDWSAELVA